MCVIAISVDIATMTISMQIHLEQVLMMLPAKVMTSFLSGTGF